jgi:exodeoxyribonuclease V alpha subunit
MEKIKCTIERITFQNPENGYSVLQATIKGYRDEQTLVGTFHEVTVGTVLTVEGTWRVDKRYGRAPWRSHSLRFWGRVSLGK